MAIPLHRRPHLHRNFPGHQSPQTKIAQATYILTDLTRKRLPDLVCHPSKRLAIPAHISTYKGRSDPTVSASAFSAIMVQSVNCLNSIYTRFTNCGKAVVQVKRLNVQVEPLLWKTLHAPGRKVGFFFLRLPNGQYGPVSQLSRSEKCCTGPFNWGGAHCAGEKVKRKIGQFQRKSLWTKQEQKHNQGAQPATATRNPPARLPGARAEKTNHNKKRLQRQILVRLNVQRSALNDALIH